MFDWNCRRCNTIENCLYVFLNFLQQESVAESARILRNAESIERLTQKAKKTKKRRKASAHKKQKQSPPTDHSKHYRLNLAEIPFVAGKVKYESHCRYILDKSTVSYTHFSLQTFKKWTQRLPKLLEYNQGWGSLCFIIRKVDYKV